MLVGHVDRVEPELVAGWAADTDAPDSIEDVIIHVGGRRAVRIACDIPRDDLRQTGEYGQGNHGFRWQASSPIPAYLHERITVRFARSGAVLPRSAVAPASSSGLNAILVTAAGRSGTTLMMQSLSASPQVCIAKHHPFEVRLISYWSTVVATLTGPADYERSMHPDRLEGDGFRVGANPLSHPDYAEVLHTGELATEYFETYLPQLFADTARTAILEYYLRVMDDWQKNQAIFFAEKNNNLDRRPRTFARGLFPDLKEIVLTRDPRDLLCSQTAYFRRDPAQIRTELTHAIGQLTRIRREDGERVLFVRYEDLVTGAKNVHAQIAAYLGTGREHSLSQEELRSSFATHGTSPSLTESIGRWKSELAPEQQSWCAANWEPFIEEFGYV
jgi:Sulfotransferase family